MDPVTASALINGASRVLGAAAAPAGPSTALGYGGASGGGVDFSGFTVNMGAGTTTGGGGSSGATGAGAGAGSGGALGGVNVSQLLMLAVVAVVILRVTK